MRGGERGSESGNRVEVVVMAKGLVVEYFGLRTTDATTNKHVENWRLLTFW